MTKVLVLGANGKMGTVTVAAIKAATELELVGTCNIKDDLVEKIQQCQPDVAVDFTLPDCVFNNAQTLIEHGVRPVIGASGLSNNQLDQLVLLCDKKQIGGIFAPNFSIGAVLMMAYAEQAARYFEYAEIIEMHHEKKIDAPSGTAKHTQNRLGAANQQLSDTTIHSIRLPGLFAHQEVIFGAPGETLTIRHDAIDRECMMPGVVLACKKITQHKQFLIGLDKLL